MRTNRRTGIIIGILFLIGTVSGIVSGALTGAMNNSQEYLVQTASGNKQFILGSLFVLLMGFSLAFIPIILYPTLKKQNQILALGYVVFRGAVETVIYIVISVSILLQVFVSKNYSTSNNTDIQQLNSAIDIILKFREINSIYTIFVFGIGALLFYSALYQSKLIPHWLSVWGIIAIILYLVTGFLIMFGLLAEMSPFNSIMSFPIFSQEMVMALWLIIKGFDPGLFDKE
jgi:hypothetical protein